MISVEDAKNSLRTQAREIASRLQRAETVPTSKALGRVLAKTVIAPISSPLFDNSAMDGFALRASETKGASQTTPVTFNIVSETAAGDPPAEIRRFCETVRIMTGAPIPTGASAVIKKEDVIESADKIQITKPAQSGENIRQRGEEIEMGNEAVPEKTVVTPGIAGFLASLGIHEVSVFALPRIAVLVTGHELVSSEEDLEPGKIFESNSVMLEMALTGLGMPPGSIKVLSDDPSSLQRELEKAIEVSDIIVLTGGVSVGDYDYTKNVLHQMGVHELFWKVAQKPGKPLYAGHLDNRIIFGLPGNPYSVFVCFYEYVRPTLLTLAHHPFAEPKRRQLKTAKPIRLDEKRAQFLKARRIAMTSETEMVEPLSGQGSHLLRPLTLADCLIYMPPGSGLIPENTPVEIIEL